MRLTDEFNDNESQTGLPVAFMLVGVMSFIVLILVVVLMANSKPKRNTEYLEAMSRQEETVQSEQTEEITDDLEIGQSTLTSDQLDFWNMYKDDEEEVRQSIPTVSASSFEQKEQELLEQEQGPDLSEGGIKTRVELPDGSEQWVMINAYIEKHKYDFVGLVYQEPVMKYYENGTNISHMGVHINKSSGDVNFKKLKEAGVEYVIIRLGMRGYQNGALSIDERYEEYITKAKEAGLEIGLSFYSQAITPEEATEEANTILSYIGENKITYPIVFDMETISNDTSRIETLSKISVTQIASAFCETIKNAGYSPMVYGNKYWLLRRMDLTKLSDYDIWLSQEEDTPDYPYKFAMWEYTKNGKIDGIEGEASLSISFIDYTMR